MPSSAVTLTDIISWTTCTVVLSKTPGYETCDGLGWYGVVIQQPEGGAS